MAGHVRTNAWNDGGNFKDAKGNYTSLYWYAIGVHQMQQRKLDDPASWWFFAAIHGEYVLAASKNGGYPDWDQLPAPPKVPVTPLPPGPKSSPFSSGQYWDQCQHANWYFAPWHRGYLVAIEARLREDIVAAGGPAEWALPYWNYFGPNTQYEIPPAFNAKQLPAPPHGLKIADPKANPLFVTARYGPDGTGTVYIPTPAGKAAHPGDPNFTAGTVTDKCMQDTDYLNGGTTGYGFGGDGPSKFAHFGKTTGDLENNPHNLVHVYVGGSQGLNGPEGLMSDPGIAALDPIFYVHHANIDRMWAAWNKPGAGAAKGHPNPTQKGWTDGPTDREFVMPWPGPAGHTTAWLYKPSDVTSLGLPKTDYTYEDLPAIPASPSPTALLGQRLAELGRGVTTAALQAHTETVPPTNSELMGANRSKVSVTGAGARTVVSLAPEVRQKFTASLDVASLNAPPDHVYLALENIRGTRDATVLNAYINVPEGKNPKDFPNLLAGSVGLFGLRRASSKSGEHAGDGLSFTLDITKIADQLHLNHALKSDEVQVSVVPSRELPEDADITIGRVAVYRKGR